MKEKTMLTDSDAEANLSQNHTSKPSIKGVKSNDTHGEQQKSQK